MSQHNNTKGLYRLRRLVVYSISLLIVGVSLQSCERDLYNQFDEEPPQKEIKLPQRTISIQKLKEMYQPGGHVLESSHPLVIQGRVISNDYDGNFYTEMYIQDETGGIKISIGMNSLYAIYPVGALVAVKANGLKLGAYGELVSLGVDTDRVSASGHPYENDRIPMPLVKEHIFCSRDIKAVEPRVISISEVSSVPDGMLVRLNNVQFIESELEQSWADASDPKNKRAEDRHLEQEGENGRLVVRTSGYARFANDSLPQGSGYIIGVLSRFRSTRQLIISSPSDLSMDAPRFSAGSSGPGAETPEANTTLKAIRQLAPTSGYKLIEEDLVISAVVISDDSHAQFYKSCYIQDSEGYGLNIQLDVKRVHLLYPFGTVLNIKLKGLAISSYEGSIRIGIPDSKYGAGRIPESELASRFFKGGHSQPSPRVISLEEAKEEMAGLYVSITDLYPEQAGSPWNDGKYNTSNVRFKDKEGHTLVARVSKYADFASDAIPSGPVTITGVLDYHKGNPQITFATISDVKQQ